MYKLMYMYIYIYISINITRNDILGLEAYHVDAVTSRIKRHISLASLQRSPNDPGTPHTLNPKP